MYILLKVEDVIRGLYSKGVDIEERSKEYEYGNEYDYSSDTLADDGYCTFVEVCSYFINEPC